MVARILAVILLFSLFVQPLRAMEYADKGPGKLQLLRIKNMMMGGEYAAAWRALRELEATDSSSSELYAMSGECHFYLKNYEDALNRLKKSVQLDANADPEKYFYLGKTYQQLGELDQAIPAYEAFLSKAEKKNEDTEEAASLAAQCRNALNMMKNPVNVTIKNVGSAINSEYPEYNPCISADGNTMIFTSRRRDGEGSAVDPYDGKFYEDVFISTRDSVTGKWTEAVPVPGHLNTEGHDACMTLTPDGNMIFVYRNMGIRGSGELYYSKKSKSSGKWSASKKLEGDINTSYFESSATISPDGKYLFFVSERPRGGYGMGDIYMAKKEGKYSWGKAVNLGPVVNDEYDQIGLFMHPDGKTLYFASNSPKSIGGYDIFKTTVDSKGRCTEPVNLGYPINTTGDERFFAVSTDGRTAWFSSAREGSEGDLDIWEIDFSAIVDAENAARQRENAKEEGPSISILTGKVIDSNAGEIVETELEIYSKDNGSTVSVSSDENGEFFITLEGGH
ncbi:MAG: PD40 domain-containing protein, partial [Bacteroidetes bacterium]|nr:PD40 domain-containing protein [Bacteroidota bacterium]